MDNIHGMRHTNKDPVRGTERKRKIQLKSNVETEREHREIPEDIKSEIKVNRIS